MVHIKLLFVSLSKRIADSRSGCLFSNQLEVYQLHFLLPNTNQFIYYYKPAMIKILQKPFGVNPPGTAYYQLLEKNQLTGVSMDSLSAKI